MRGFKEKMMRFFEAIKREMAHPDYPSSESLLQVAAVIGCLVAISRAMGG